MFYFPEEKIFLFFLKRYIFYVVSTTVLSLLIYIKIYDNIYISQCDIKLKNTYILTIQKKFLFILI